MLKLYGLRDSLLSNTIDSHALLPSLNTLPNEDDVRMTPSSSEQHSGKKRADRAVKWKHLNTSRRQLSLNPVHYLLKEVWTIFSQPTYKKHSSMR